MSAGLAISKLVLNPGDQCVIHVREGSTAGASGVAEQPAQARGIDAGIVDLITISGCSVQLITMYRGCTDRRWSGHSAC